jgi:hypothetical protein
MHQLSRNSTEIVGRDCFPGLRVSTVRLEPEPARGWDEYETMIFHRLPNGQCADEIYCERYDTREDAEHGHRRLCKLVAAIQEAGQ